MIIDDSGDNNITFREFRRACRAYGFDCGDGQASIRAVFNAFDVEGNGSLSMEEVMFLDDWEFAVDSNSDSNEAEHHEPVFGGARLAHVFAEDGVARYETEGPGPAACGFASTLGAGPRTPMLRFSGAFSFRRRTDSQRLPGLVNDSAHTPSPADWKGLSFAETTARSKPSWGFGSASRMKADAETGPGPGTYGLVAGSLDGIHVHRGRAATCTPRRPMRMHPLFKG